MFIVRNIDLNNNVHWDNLLDKSQTANFFQTREWLSLWVKHFDGEMRVLGVYDNEELVGIAPFHIKEGTINFLGTGAVLGGELVSDFGDIIALAGKEREIWEVVLKGIRPARNASRSEAGGDQGLGIRERIEFNFVREDSPSFKILQDLAGSAEEVEVAPYIDLPKTWDEYLMTLGRHDRHELRRKMRKLEDEGAFKVCPKPEESDINEFFRLMQLGSKQKRDFLSDEMRQFFRDIFKTFTPKGMLRLCFIEIDNKNIAAVLSFLYKDEVLLYNSGFDPNYSYLSPGLLLKAYIIRQSIEEGKRRFDFLRGGERYKYDLGGKKRNLYKISF